MFVKGIVKNKLSNNHPSVRSIQAIDSPLDADEQNRCNVPSPISKSCYKILVHSHQIEKNIYDKLVLNSWVLVKCYPDMDGAGQSGWLVNNDVEGHSNIVKLFLPNK